MAAIQPQFAAPLDRRNPLVRGLVSAAYPYGNGLVDACGVRWTLGASALRGGGLQGRELRGDANAGAVADRNLIPTTATEYTVMLLVSGGSGTGMAYSGTDGSNALGQSGTNYYSWMTFLDFGPATVGKYDQVLQTQVAGGNHVQYLNGKQVASSGSAQMSGFGGNTTLMCRGGAGSVSFLGNLALLLVWNRGLSPAEVADLTDNPWQVFRSAPTQRYAAVTSSGVSGSLASQLGAFAGAFAGFPTVNGSFASSLSNNNGAFAGNPIVGGSISTSLGNQAGAYSGSSYETGVLNTTLSALTSIFSGTTAVAGALASVLGSVYASFTDGASHYSARLSAWFVLFRRGRR